MIQTSTMVKQHSDNVKSMQKSIPVAKEDAMSRFISIKSSKRKSSALNSLEQTQTFSCIGMEEVPESEEPLRKVGHAQSYKKATPTRSLVSHLS